MTEPNSDKQTNYKTANLAASQSVPNAMLKFRRPLIVLAHLVAFAVSLLLSFLATSNMQLQAEWLTKQSPTMLVLVIVVKIAIFGLFKQYRGWWRYVGISDLTGIVRAS
ncbi:MAG: hypothetical protein WBL85_06345, partial [Sedimentisphaerales bacterium]